MGNVQTGAGSSTNYDFTAYQYQQQQQYNFDTGMSGVLNPFDTGTDQIATGWVPVNFGSQADPNTNPNNPNLPPVDPNASDGPSPLTTAAQTLVEQDFIGNLANQLPSTLTNDQTRQILNYASTGQGTLPPDLLAIATPAIQAATQQTQTDCRLPNTWTLTSTNASDWTPSPPPPYPKVSADVRTNYENGLIGQSVAFINSQTPPFTGTQAAAYLSQMMGDANPALTPDQLTGMLSQLTTIAPPMTPEELAAVLSSGTDPGLTDDQLSAIFAQMLPNQTFTSNDINNYLANASPIAADATVSAAYQQVTQGAIDAMQGQPGVPANWTPSTVSQQDINQSYDTSLITNLETQLRSRPPTVMSAGFGSEISSRANTISDNAAGHATLASVLAQQTPPFTRDEIFDIVAHAFPNLNTNEMVDSFTSQVMVMIQLINITPPTAAAQLAALNTLTGAADLTPDQLADITDGINGGFPTVGSADTFNQVVTQTTTDVQNTFGLPGTWVRGTQNLSDWEPINLSPISPTNVSTATYKGMTQNILDAGTLLSGIGNSLSALMNAGPGQVKMIDFLKAIATAIANMKQAIQELEMADQQLKLRISQAKQQEISQQTGVTDQKIQADISKMEEQAAAAAKAAQTHLLMQILGPIITVIMSIIAVLLAVFTGGASLLLIAAAVAVGIAMTAYSIADSCCNLTGKMVTAFENWITNDVCKDMSPADAAAVKATIIAAICIVAIVVIAALAASGGEGAIAEGAMEAGDIASTAAADTATAAVTQEAGQAAVQAAEEGAAAAAQAAAEGAEAAGEGAGTVAGQAAEQAATAGTKTATTVATSTLVRQIATEVTSQLIENFLIMFVASTNPISDLLKAIMTSAGCSKEAIMAMEVTVTIITVVAAAAAASGAKGLGTSAAKLGSFEDAINKAGNDFIDSVNKLPQTISNAADNFSNAIKDLLASLKNEGGNVSDEVATVAKDADELAKSVKTWTTGVRIVAGVAPSVAQGVSLIIQGKMALVLAKLEELCGDIEAQLTTLKGILKLMEKMLSNIDNGMQDSSDLISQLGQMVAKIYSAANQTTGALAASCLGGQGA